jgi:hypothetical protein
VKLRAAEEQKKQCKSKRVMNILAAKNFIQVEFFTDLNLYNIFMRFVPLTTKA